MGLSCTDLKNRVRYPTVAKRAIAAKIVSDGLSEEMRVLYVAMTRARDRLIMTYASRDLGGTLCEIAMRSDLSDPCLLAADADCPGAWVLQTALRRTEAGAFYALAGHPDCVKVSAIPWSISVQQATQNIGFIDQNVPSTASFNEKNIIKIKNGLSFRYANTAATTAPSKMTATQMKGRDKDQESAENTHDQKRSAYNWRVPSFVDEGTQGKEYGNAVHAVMQYIQFSKCETESGIACELDRLEEQGYISIDQKQMINLKEILSFFSSDLGKRLIHEKDILREFKFSILDKGENYDPLLKDEHVLLQGVVDCALVEDDGITIIDFKTDRVTEEKIPEMIDKYGSQVRTYANALSRIYSLPIKSKQLFLFRLNRFVEIP